MKVKTAELKNRLSYYILKVRESGEAIEVCSRDQTVAFLAPALPENSTRVSVATQYEQEVLRRQLLSAGLVWEVSAGQVKLPSVQPQLAGDGRQDLQSVAAIRGERGW